MNRAFPAILASVLLVAFSNACSSAPADRQDERSVTLCISPPAATPTGDVLVTVRAATKGVQVTALQWTFRYDSNLLSPVSFSVASKPLALQKTIRCASRKNETRCVLWGNNAKPIPNGDIAEARFRPRASLPISKAVIKLDQSVATSGEGESISVVPALFIVGISNAASASEFGSRRLKDANNERSEEAKDQTSEQNL